MMPLLSFLSIASGIPKLSRNDLRASSKSGAWRVHQGVLVKVREMQRGEKRRNHCYLPKTWHFVCYLAEM